MARVITPVPDIAGMVAAMIESELRMKSEKASHYAFG